MELLQHLGFLGNSDDYARSSIVLYGAPMDFTTSFRPGTRFGPRRVREISEGLEEYSPMLDRALSEVVFYDAGDVEFGFGNIEAALRKIGQAAERFFTDNKFPLMIGGEHLVSLAPIKEAFKKYPDLAVLQFDAHADLRDEYFGEPHSHATVIGNVAKLIGGKNVYQFGIRSGTRQEFEFGRENTNFYPYQVLDPLQKALAGLGDRPIYVTIDIDVVDPAYAPGTGTPEAGGISSWEMLQVIYALKEKNVIAMDIVELSPVLDSQDITALLVGKLVREAILAFGSGGN